MKLTRALLKFAMIVLIITAAAYLMNAKRPELRPANSGSAVNLPNSSISVVLARNAVAQPAALKSKPKNFGKNEWSKLGTAWDQPVKDSPVEGFHSWFEEYHVAALPRKKDMEKEGVMLARERKRFLEVLIQSDPELALELAVPVSVRRELPASIIALLEERISGRGDLSVLGALPEPGKESEVIPTFRTATIDGKKYQAFAYGRRLGEPTKRNIALNGIAIGELFAVNENPVRLLETAEVVELARNGEEICSVSGDASTSYEDETVVEVGNEIVFLCQSIHVEDLNRSVIAAESNDVEASARTEGQKKLIFIRVDFSDLIGEPFPDATGITLVNNLNNFFRECSYGRASMYLIGQGSDHTPTFRMPHSARHYGTNNLYDNLRADARAAATTAGYVLADYDFDLICMGPVPGFNWSGLGYVGADGAWLRNSFGVGTSAHELGHNYGLNHADFWDTKGMGIIGTNGTDVEYGDNMDRMGSAASSDYHFNSRYKRHLNWLTSSEVMSANVSGTYQLFCHDNTNSTGMRALSVAKDVSTNYWVEFRQKHTGNRYLMNGVYLRWTRSGNQRSLLLDTTPGSPDGKTDSALVIGRTFSDPAAGVHITPIGKRGTVPESIDVVVNKGSFPTNVSPTITVLADATNVSSGAVVDFRAAATDSNGDALAYYWDFGDKNFGTNSTRVSKSWSTGEYVVRCTVTDMKGGTASDSVIVRVGSPTTYRISGTIKRNNTPIEGVRVYVSSTRVTYTDSDGTYNLVGLPAGSYTVNAYVDRFTLLPYFSNPVAVGLNTPHQAGLDFNTAALVPPSFTSHPQNRSVTVGDNTTFSGTATGTEPISYTWKLNGSILTNATNYFYELTDAQLENAGTYSLVASNQGGTATSSNALLTVNAPPIMAVISNCTVTEGSLLSFKIHASDPGTETTNLFANFENHQTGASSVMFLPPNASGVTTNFLNASPTLSRITNNFPQGIFGARVVHVNWAFANGATNAWLHLSTLSASALPNPTVHFGQKLQFMMYADRPLKVGIGLRETDAISDIGANGGSDGDIEFAGVAEVTEGTPLPSRSIPSGQWTMLEFDLPNEPIQPFTGNGILESTSGKGVLEHLALVPEDGAGTYNIYLDNFAMIAPGPLTFSLEPGAPPGASIDPESGIFSWIPEEVDATKDFEITVRATDHGRPALSVTTTFIVTVTKTNSAPVLTGVSNQFVNAGATMTFTNFATDNDFPANVLTFSLGQNSLEEASLDPVSGVFVWTAPHTEIVETNLIDVIVSDNGVPSLSDTNSVAIVVIPPPQVASMISEGDEVTLTWQTFPGKSYRLQYKNSLEEIEWIDLGELVIAEGGTILISDNIVQPQRFYRLLQLD